VIEHLAYALSVTEKFAKNRRTKNFLQLDAVIKKCFLKHMSKHALTRGLLVENNLLKNFSFTSKDLATGLAKCFYFPVPENSAGLVLVEGRALEIPECPVYLAPIKYGIRFEDDPNWYDVKAAYETIFITNANRPPLSPMTRYLWAAIEEVRKFSFVCDDVIELECDVQSAEFHRKIAERLELINRLGYVSELVIMMVRLPDIARPCFVWDAIINLVASAGAVSLTYFELTALDSLANPIMQSMDLSRRMSHFSGLFYLPFSIYVFYHNFSSSKNFLQRLRNISQPEHRHPGRQGELLRTARVNIRDLVDEIYEQVVDAAPVINRPAQNNWSVAGLMRRFGVNQAPAPRDEGDELHFEGMQIAGRLGFR
jgi:hypothetical protein